MAKKRASRDQWLQRVRAWKASGLTCAKFVKGKGFSASALRWWTWKLGSEGEELEPRAERVDFFEVVAPTSEGRGLTLRLGRVEVEVIRGFDAETLARVLDVLEARA